MRTTCIVTLFAGLVCVTSVASAQRFLEQLEGVLDAESDAAEEAAPPVRVPGYLGLVAIEQLNRVEVETVRAESAAERAGLQPGDVVLLADGRAVKTLDQLGEALAGRLAGERVSFVILRDGKPLPLRATLAQRPGETAVVDEVPSEPDPFAPDIVREPARPKPGPTPEVPIDSLEALRALEDVLDAESSAEDPPAPERPTAATERDKRIAAFESELEAIKRRIRELEREVGELTAED